MLVNLALLAAIGVTGWQVRVRYDQQRRNFEKFLTARTPAPAPPALATGEMPGQVSAATYAELALKLPFSKDRNPIVVIDAPPPKPMPPLPRYYGRMNFGDGMFVILSASGTGQKRYRVGEQIGDFKLLSVGDTGLVFEWDGKKVPASWAEMADKSGNQPGSGQQASMPGPAQGQPAPAQAKAVQSVSSAGSAAGSADGKPGVDVGGDTRACNPGDTTPNGTVTGGYRKIMSQTPFGMGCRWEKVN